MDYRRTSRQYKSAIERIKLLGSGSLREITSAMQDKGNLLLKLALFLLAAIAIGFFLFTISDIVKLVIIAGLLAYILDPLANIMESRGMSRTSATVAIFVGIVLLSVVSYFVFLPLLSEEIKSLKNGFGPEQTGAMVSRLEEFLATNLSFIGVRDYEHYRKIAGRHGPYRGVDTCSCYGCSLCSHQHDPYTVHRLFSPERRQGI